MPIVPTVIPLIVAGVVMGSMLLSGKRKITKKRVLGASVVGGLLNAANALVVYMLFPPTSFSRFGGGNFGGGNFGGSTSFTFTGSSNFAYRGGGAGGGEGSFIILSFIAGLLIVLVVVGSALLYVKYKGGHAEEELSEEKEGEQEDLEESEQKEQEEI